MTLKNTDEFGIRLQWEDSILETAVTGCSRKIGPYPCCSVVEGDCEILMHDIPSQVIDSVVVDPPYPKEFLPVLARAWPECRRVARDGAWMFVMSGQIWLERVMRDITAAGWFYRWMGSFRMPRANSPIWPIGISTGWKPLLMYGTDPKQKFKPWKYDVLENGTSTEDDKQFHEWGQSYRQFIMLLQRFEIEGTVLDPFCGSGTTLIAAKLTGQHFLGLELDSIHAEQARKRLAEIDAQPNLFEPKPEQMTL